MVMRESHAQCVRLGRSVSVCIFLDMFTFMFACGCVFI